MVIWMMAIAVSAAALIITAAMRYANPYMGYLHLAIAACISIFFALEGIRNIKATAAERGASPAVAGETLHAIAMVWAWAAIVIALTFGTGVMVWKEWLAHFVGLMAGAGICLAIASVLNKSGVDNVDDPTMMSVARYLLIGLLVAMLAVIIGFLIDGQMKRFLVDRYTDWPAKNVIFFAAIAVAAISGAGLKLLPQTK